MSFIESNATINKIKVNIQGSNPSGDPASGDAWIFIKADGLYLELPGGSVIGPLAAAGAPGAHATSHQNGGGDEISVAGLSGVLADAQTPAAHGHDSADVTYTPAANTDWNSDTDPGNVDDALDQLAARVDDVEAGSIASLDDIGDVNVPSPSDGDLLVWDADAEEWIAASSGAPSDHDHSGAGEGGTFDAANLTSNSASDGDVLTADGSGGAAWEAPTGGSGGMELIEEKSPNGSTSTETFNSIPNTYRSLMILIYGRATTSGSGNSDIYIQFNSDTGSNYDKEMNYFGSSSGVSQTLAVNQPVLFALPQASVAVGKVGSGRADIPYYASTSFHKNALSVFGTNGIAAVSSVHWLNTAAISSITLGVVSSGNFESGTKIALYGLK